MELELIFGKRIAIKIHTDEGITGVSGTHTVGRINAVKTAIEMLKPYLIGKDPLKVEKHWEAMYVDPCFRGSIMSTALAAVDVALWDIIGKFYGAPIYSLMGGPTRDKIKLIATVNAGSLEETLKNVQKLIETGFKAIRITPFPRGFQNLSHSELIMGAVKQVKATREIVGDEIEVAVECLTRLRPYEAIALGKELEKYRILFYEDPILWENAVNLAEIQRSITIPVATGERLYSLYQYQNLLNNKASQIIRPDVLIAGGLTNLKKISALAQANYVEMVPHNPSNRFGLLSAVNAHLCASVNNIIALEYANGVDLGNEDPSRTEIIKPLEIKDGYLTLPKKPGIGVSLNEKNIGEGIPRPWSRWCLRDDGGVWHT